VPTTRRNGPPQHWYYVPTLAHAPMQPPNATARLTDGKCEVCAGAINVTLLGGGFGRKSDRERHWYADHPRAGAELPHTLPFDASTASSTSRYSPAGASIRRACRLG
jgi:hypothetical protein